MSEKKETGGGPGVLSFEDALARLETIVQELEGKELTLEETLARYEEGSRLVQECTRRLDAAEQRIRKIGAAAAGPEETEEREDGEESGEDEDDGDLPF